jgi:uncharacterized BrkB/YihY/UPF0761 family membrane protein
VSTSATNRFESLRARSEIAETGVRIVERDRDAAGTLLGSALALRFFLFFLPLILFGLGVMGLVGRYADVDAGASQVGITGALADQIDDGFNQGSTAPWLATITGLLGIVTTGRSLTRALVVSSGLSWKLGGQHRMSVRVLGTVVGLTVGVAVSAALLNRIRAATGLAVASMGFVVVVGVYIVLFSFVYLALPRGTTDPGAALPGAVLVALTLAGMQAFSMLYLPAQISRSSTTYGAIGVAITTLGWFFILGRAIAFSFAVNAIVFEQHGSLSRVVFSLPVLRTIPRRSARFAQFFDLVPHDRPDDDGRNDSADPDRAP